MTAAIEALEQMVREADEAVTARRKDMHEAKESLARRTELLAGAEKRASELRLALERLTESQPARWGRCPDIAAPEYGEAARHRCCLDEGHLGEHVNWNGQHRWSAAQ